MAHKISGIITSFQYKGEHPAIVLVGNYFFIPVNKSRYEDKIIKPYDQYNTSAKQEIKELSFKGRCIYLETNFFVEGTQLAEIWEDGTCIEGPLISFHGYKTKKEEPENTLLVSNAINTALKLIGIYKHENKDEFDSVRLGDYRSNDEILSEYYYKNKI